MSKRAKIAEKKYYGNLYYSQMRKERDGFIKGYEQDQKDTIEMALDWLKYAQKKKMSFDAAIDYFKAIMEGE